MALNIQQGLVCLISVLNIHLKCISSGTAGWPTWIQFQCCSSVESAESLE